MLNEIQTDYGYRWIYGFSDGANGQQVYQVQDLLNNVNRLQIQQWNHGQSSTNNQTALNAAGTGNVCFNCSSNAGTGGVSFSSGGQRRRRRRPWTAPETRSSTELCKWPGRRNRREP